MHTLEFKSFQSVEPMGTLNNTKCFCTFTSKLFISVLFYFFSIEFLSFLPLSLPPLFLSSSPSIMQLLYFGDELDAGERHTLSFSSWKLGEQG